MTIQVRPNPWIQSRGLRLAALLLLLSLTLVACGPADTEATTAGPAVPTIVASTSIWGDVVANVACGGLATVDVLIPPGADPHAFEPSLADRGRLEKAALVVSNGLGLEERLEDTIESVESAGTPVFHIAEHIDTIEIPEEDGQSDDHGHGHADDAGHAHEGDDPHVWLDPVRVSAALPELADHLVEDAGLDADAVNACVTAYQTKLAEVHHELEHLLEEIPEDRRLLVTNHDALGYLADRYGFQVVGTVIPSTSSLAEPNAAALEELARTIEAMNIPAVFTEALHAKDVVDALATRVGDLQVVTLFTDALGEPGSGAETYLGLLRTNATRIRDALT